jgi:SAM-dependent methyltransferase
MLESVPCNLCGAEGGETVYPAAYDAGQPRDLARVFRASADELLIDRLERCRTCGLQFVNPRPAGNAIVDAYTEGDDPAYVSQVDARERTFDDALARIERLNGGPGRILDIGTAAGAFLAAAQKRGWKVEGCEPNRWLAEWGSKRYGLDIRPGEIFAQSYAPQSFDVVTLWDVIEHTPDPARVIAKCRELLKPGGLLIVNYPDIGSWIARAMKRKWPFLSSVHLFYFTRRTMRAFLERQGFSVVEMRPHFQRLELDYLLARGDVVSLTLSRWSRRAVKALGLSRKQAPYWLGQTFVAARRRA